MTRIPAQVLLPLIEELSTVIVFLPKDLRSAEQRASVDLSLQDVQQRRFPDGLPLVDPIEGAQRGSAGWGGGGVSVHPSPPLARAQVDTLISFDSCDMMLARAQTWRSKTWC